MLVNRQCIVTKLQELRQPCTCFMQINDDNYDFFTRNKLLLDCNLIMLTMQLNFEKIITPYGCYTGLHRNAKSFGDMRRQKPSTRLLRSRNAKVNRKKC